VDATDKEHTPVASTSRLWIHLFFNRVQPKSAVFSLVSSLVNFYFATFFFHGLLIKKNLAIPIY
jgi:hypothetical protein